MSEPNEWERWHAKQQERKDAEDTRPNPSALIWGRHFVGWLIAAAIVEFATRRPGGGVLIVLGGAILFGAVVAGLAALFLTRREAKHTARNFILSTWLGLFLPLLSKLL